MEGRGDARRSNGSIQSVSAIVEGREIVLSPKKFAIYKITVVQGEKTRYVFRRYSDFKLLNDQLQKANVLPQGFFSRTMVPRTRFHLKNRFSVTFLDARQYELQRYLTELLKRPGITEVARIKQFLSLPDETQPEPVQIQNNRPLPAENDEKRAMTGNEWQCIRQEVQDCKRKVGDMQKCLLEMQDYMSSILKKNAWSTYPIEVVNNPNQ